jgi:DNA invertase Pin-like site-specific DNA recombinase
MPTYGYTRVSTQAQADDGQSLDVQGRQLQGWAMIKGVELDELFVERGVSGSMAIKTRPEGGRMWRLLRKGDTVVASKLDRMFRSALDALQMVEELRAKGASLILLDLGTDPVTNGLSRTFLTIAAAFAEAERDRIKERIGQVKADQKTRGRYLGGKLPFGYAKGPSGELVEVTAEQSIIARILALRTAGKPLRGIQANVAASCGRQLSLDAISRIAAEAPNR